MDVNKPYPETASPVSGTQGEDRNPTDSSEDVGYQGSFVASALRCRDLGWRLAAVDAREMVDLGVNFDEPAELWMRQCSHTGPLPGQVNLGVHTGSASGLVVLEVGNGEGNCALDHCGSWRSSCRARKSGREQHYYTLPPGTVAPRTGFLRSAQVMVYGEGGLAPLPPSVDVQTREAWRWSTPPWAYPPRELPPGLLEFLQQNQLQGTVPETTHQVLPWEEVYRLITPHEQVLKALLSPYRSLEEYYRDLLDAALNAGFEDHDVLLSLLWHAPQGDASRNPGRGAQLERLVKDAGIKSVTATATGPGSETPGHDSEQSILVPLSHYEIILADLRRLMQKAAELEAVLSGWGERLASGRIREKFVPGAPPHVLRDPSVKSYESCQRAQNLRPDVPVSPVPPKAHSLPGSRPMPGEDDDDLWLHAYTELPSKVQAGLSPEVVESTISACLQKNPDLAKDPNKLRMVQYCFKNYVNIDPNLADLSLLERLERASQMANEFLGGHN